MDSEGRRSRFSDSIRNAGKRSWIARNGSLDGSKMSFSHSLNVSSGPMQRVSLPWVDDLEQISSLSSLGSETPSDFFFYNIRRLTFIR